MKRLFLASSIHRVAKRIAQEIGGANNKPLAFITTASEIESGEKEWVGWNRQGLVDAGFQVADYTLAGKTADQIRNDLEAYDIIHLNGGNSFYLLQVIQQTNSAQVIRELVANGKIFTGSSAGSIVAGPDIYPVYSLDNAKKAPYIVDYQGLTLVDFVILPHWGRADFREKYLNQRLEQNYHEKNKLILLNDNQYVSVSDGQYKIVDITKD